MKQNLLALFLLLSSAGMAQFTANNIAVSKISSSTAIGNTGTSYATSIVEYTTAGATTGTNIMLTGGTPNFVTEERPVAHETQLSLSGNGMYLTLIGYNNTPGQTAVTIRTSEKRIARIDASGAVDLTTSIPTSQALNSVSVRTAVSADGSSYFLTSSATNVSHGTRTIAHGSDQSPVFNNTSYRSIMLFNNSLYGTTLGASKLFSLDAVGNANEMPFAAQTGYHDYTQFVFFDLDGALNWDGTGYDLVYIADRNAGIRKFYFDGSVWTPVSETGLYNPAIGSTAGFYGLTGRVEGGKPTLYGVKIRGAYTSSHLIKIVDNASRNGDWATTDVPSATELASTGNTEMFKGVAFTPGSNVALLPLKLLSFTGAIINNSAALSWATTAEINVKEYVMEKSKNGNDFAPIGSFAARATSSTNNYTLNDPLIDKGFNYYRLKMIEKDGSFQYSSIVMLKGDAQLFQSIKVYPNPVVSNVVVNHPATEKGAFIKIISNNGRVVAQYKVTANATQTSIDASGLAKGQYIVEYIGQGKIKPVMFVK